MSETQETQKTDDVKVTSEAQQEEKKTPEKTDYEKQLEHDNFKQREEIRVYKEEITNLKDSVSQLTDGFNSLKQTLQAKQEEEGKEQKEKELAKALEDASIVDEGAVKLAKTLLKDSTNFAEDIKKLAEEYPLLAGKKKVLLPDTGKAKETQDNLSGRQLLSVGIEKMMNK